MKLDISINELAPAGVAPGVFADAYTETVTDKRKKTSEALTVVVELAAVNSNDKHFLVSRTYSMTTRGKKMLWANLQTWRGKALTSAEKASFDPEAEFVGKNCAATVVHENAKGGTVAKLRAFTVDPKGTLKVSPDFVRHKDDPAQKVQIQDLQAGGSPVAAPTVKAEAVAV